MDVAMNGQDRRELERRRVARITQEVVENQRELAEILYVWDMRMVANDTCVIMPGDYMAVGDGCMCSSRGALVDMSASDIADLVGAGGLHQVFDMDDLNAPDFSSRINDVMSKIACQRQYQDADAYYCSHDLERAVAVYDPEPASDSETVSAPFAVERRGAGFAYRNEIRGDFGQMRQCSYEEFNPGGIEIRQAVTEEVKPEQAQSRSKLFTEMLDRYQKGGENDIVKPSDAVKRIPGFDQMSPMEQLRVKHKLADEYHRAMDRDGSQEQGPDASDQWGPRLPGQTRF